MPSSSRYEGAYSNWNQEGAVRCREPPAPSDLVGSYHRKEAPRNRLARAKARRSKHRLSGCMVRYEQPRAPCNEEIQCFPTARRTQCIRVGAKDRAPWRAQSRKSSHLHAHQSQYCNTKQETRSEQRKRLAFAKNSECHRKELTCLASNHGR